MPSPLQAFLASHDPLFELAISQNATMAVYLLYQKQRYLVPKVKAAVDFLVKRIKETDGSVKRIE